MKLPKAVFALLGSLALLTVGAPIASAAPAYQQTYYQPVQQYSDYYGYNYGYGYCYGYGYGHHGGC